MTKAKPAEVAVVSQMPAAQSAEILIAQAIEKGASVDTMERLLAMRTQLKGEFAKEAFIKAMSNFQAQCPIIVKDKIVYDKQGKERYRFAPLENIVTQVRKPLTENGFSYTVDVINDTTYLTAICKVTHILGHSETSSFQVPIDKDGYMSAPQKYAAASTFAKRYAFVNATGILTGDEDSDATPETVHEEKVNYQVERVIQMADDEPGTRQVIDKMTPKEQKADIFSLLKALKHEPKDKKGAEKIVAELTSVELIEENYPIILERLRFLWDEANEK